jgi:hypothetical protein
MSMPTDHSLRTRVLRALGAGSMVVFCALALAELPREASVDLRYAGDMLLDFTLRQGRALGVALETLGGPLGGLAATHHSGQALWPHYWWQLASSLALGTFVTWLGFRLRPGPRWGFWLVFLALTAFRPAAAHLAIALLAGLVLIRVRLPALPAAAVGFLLGGLALIEAPLAWIALLALAGAFAARPREERRSLAGAGAALGGTLLLGWVLADQSLLHFLPWLGQGAAALPGHELTFDRTVWTPLVGGCGLVAVLGSAALLLPARDAEPAARRVGWWGAAFVVVALWIGWLRQLGQLDGLAPNFFAVVVPFAFASLAFGPDAARGRRALVLAAGCGGILATEPRLLAQPVILLNSRLVENVERFADRRAWQRTVRDATRDLAKIFSLPNVQQRVGPQSIDLLADAVCYGLLANLNYTPRPTGQSLTAESRGALERNGTFYAGPQAPDFVAQRLQGWGGSLPAAMDPRAQLALYYRYDFLFEENSFVLWQRRPDARVPDLAAAPANRQGARWRQGIALPPVDPPALWVSFDLRRSWWGELRRWFWPGDVPVLRVRDEQGNISRYRLPPAAAASGVLLRPFFRGEFDLAAYQAGVPLPAVREIALEADADTEAVWEFSGVSWRPLPPVPATGRTAPAEAIAHRYRAANRLPQAITTEYPPAPIQVDGQEALLVNPEGALEFPLLPGDTRVTGDFGLVDGAYKGGNITDGVEFVIELHGGDGAPRVLLRRFLDPLNEPADRGSHRFEVQLPRPVSGRLVLRTTNPPRHNGAFDWSYWRQLRFE